MFISLHGCFFFLFICYLFHVQTNSCFVQMKHAVWLLSHIRAEYTMWTKEEKNKHLKCIKIVLFKLKAISKSINWSIYWPKECARSCNGDASGAREKKNDNQNDYFNTSSRQADWMRCIYRIGKMSYSKNHNTFVQFHLHIYVYCNSNCNDIDRFFCLVCIFAFNSSDFEWRQMHFQQIDFLSHFSRL